VVEADIRGYFENIDHRWLVRMLEQRIDDQRLIRLKLPPPRIAFPSSQLPLPWPTTPA